ncbi:helix-turn-helix domain-containing protein [Romboutsia ilealis]|uniref:helix-turn-helix domain-containing protein n=1 Tax=Romboutsia ilealis TaxID=1115758 RepID=UPI0023F56E0C|nr:helix-turn-helix transcriptional regulator [Romboutsia ilealis]
MELFSIRFKEERKSKGLTQEQLAKEFFLNKSSISRYEKGTQMPEMVMLQKFAEYFDVSVDYLLGRTDERNAHKEKSKLDEGIKTIAAHRVNPYEDISEEGINKINEYIEMVRMMEQNKK